MSLETFFTFVIIFIVSVWDINGKEEPMKLYLFPENTVGAQCLDGSPAGFYYQAPPSGSSDLWIIELEGGGGCSTETDCMQRANSTLGSSKNWSTIHYGNSVLNTDPKINPDFYQGHKVFCPYCNGDGWSGQRSSPSSDPDTWGLYFSGHLVFKSIIQYLSLNSNILNSSHVLLTGASAGGVGTYSNADWLFNVFKSQSKNANLVFKAAPVAGFHAIGNATDEPQTPMLPPNDYPHWVNHEQGGPGRNDSTIVLYDAYLNPKCVAAFGSDLSWHCGSIYNAYKYMETPLFVMSNKFDKYPLVHQYLLPTTYVNANTTAYVEYYGVDADRTFYPLIIDNENNQNGLFYASCLDHVAGLGIGKQNPATIINGYDSSCLVGDWFWERNKLPHFVYDTCNNNTYKLPCNPTCDSYP